MAGSKEIYKYKFQAVQNAESTVSNIRDVVPEVRVELHGLKMNIVGLASLCRKAGMIAEEHGGELVQTAIWNG